MVCQKVLSIISVCYFLLIFILNYRERNTRVNMTWNAENDTITFRQIREWHFVPEKSSGSENDRVVALNVLGAVSE